MMRRSGISPEQRKMLVVAGLCETVCLGIGLVAFFMTSKVIWLVIGIVAGAGFSLPAIVRFVRAARQADNAPR